MITGAQVPLTPSETPAFRGLMLGLLKMLSLKPGSKNCL